MKRNFILALLIILFVISLAGASIGYFHHKQRGNDEPELPPITAQIKYLYYLDDVEVTKNEIIKNENQISSNLGVSTTTEDESEILYSNSSCTNGVTGTYNKETGEFTPNEEKDSVCKLYFNKSKYEVTLTVTNGEADETNKKYIKRESNGQFKITPSEGYEFDSSTCSNNKEAQWDVVNNLLTINAITNDVACKVVFKIKTIKMELKVENGTGNTTESAEYGKGITAVVNANEGYEFDSVTCTNDQTATYANNTISIEKLTQDTICSVKYKQVIVEKFTLEIKDLPFTIKVTEGGTIQSIKKGDSGIFTLKPDAGFRIKSIDCEGVTPSKLDKDGATTYTFLNMTKNVTCTVVSEQISG